MTNITIAHIINPFIVNEDSDLFTAQPVTFETMRMARDSGGTGIKIELFAAFYPEDESMIPDFFTKTRPLDRSILDIDSFHAGKQRKLPLIKDILDRLYEQSTADYFIYTNVDIALMPGFYKEVGKILKKGYDGVVINRRTITTTHSRVEDIPRMISEAKKGEKHPGYDCFIFKREAYKHYRLGTACVGANWIGRALIGNVMAFAPKFKIFEDEHLTFHIGDDRPWLGNENNDYNQYNENQVITILNTLMELPEVHNKDALRKTRAYLLEIHRAHPAIPADIVRMNSPVYQLPDKPGAIYFSQFRPSSSWEKFPEQRLRQDPVFIVGYPRSGTTLVQALLTAQEGIHSFYETHFFSIVRKKILLNDQSITPGCMDDVILKIRERTAFSENAEEHVKNLAQNNALSVKMLFETVVIDNFINKIAPKQLSQIRWMEKTPEHALYLDIISRFYPAAKVIHVLRHPEKAILSRRRHFTFNNEAAWLIEKHIQKWLDCVTAVNTFGQSHPGSVLTVRLEDVTKNTGDEMQKICDFLGITLDKNRLKDHKEISGTLYYPWETWKNSAAQDISHAIASPKNRRLSEPDREKLRKMAGEELKKYGYKITTGSGMLTAARTVAGKGLSRLKRTVRKPNRGKLNMSEQLHLFYGRHRSGWIYAVRSLKELHNPRGVFFDAFIERTFAWRPNEVRPHLEPWIGFIHVPPNVPDWFQGNQSNDTIFKSDAWQKSLPHCKGLYTLSNYHRKYLETKLDIPIENLLFPTETPDRKWDPDRFAANKEKKIVQIGWWLRKIHSIFQLPAADYKKIFLKVNYFDWDELIRKEREILLKQGTFKDEMYDTAETVEYLPDKQYDGLLSENIVLLNLYDSSANNTIIECIARNTPILVNPLESVKEYLGEDYPLYFSSLEEAAEKAQDTGLVYRAHDYLKNHPVKDKMTGDYFRESIKKSGIYQGL